VYPNQHPFLFFYRLSQATAKQLSDGLLHPVEKGFNRRRGYGGFGGGFAGGDGFGGRGGRGGRGGSVYEGPGGVEQHWEEDDGCGKCDVYCEDKRYLNPCKKRCGPCPFPRYAPNFRAYAGKY